MTQHDSCHVATGYMEAWTPVRSPSERESKVSTEGRLHGHSLRCQSGAHELSGGEFLRAYGTRRP